MSDNEEAPEEVQAPIIIQAVAEPAAEEPTPEKKKKRTSRRNSVNSKLAEPPAVKEAIDECRNMKSDVNGVIIELLKNGKKFSLATEPHVFTGGLPEMLEFLRENSERRIFYLYILAHGEDDLGLAMDRFIMCKYTPEDAPVMLRAQSGTFDGQIQELMKHQLKLTVDQEFEPSLAPEAIAKKLMSNMGSDKPTRMFFGPDCVIDVSDVAGDGGAEN